MNQALIQFVLLAMKTWTPVAAHSVTEERAVTEARYQSIAETIAEVASSGKQLFTGDTDRRMAAALLVSVADAESHFTAGVDSCAVAGDNGHAWSMWQVHKEKEVLCSSRAAAARIALDIMGKSFNECRSLPDFNDRLSVYTDGHCFSTNRSRWRVSRAMRFAQTHQLVAVP